MRGCRGQPSSCCWAGHVGQPGGCAPGTHALRRVAGVTWCVGQERSSGANRKEQPTPNGASGLHHIVRLRRMTEDEQALASAHETSSGVTHCTRERSLALHNPSRVHHTHATRGGTITKPCRKGAFPSPFEHQLVETSPVLPTPPRSLPPRWTTPPPHHHLPTCTKTCNQRPTAPAAQPGTGPRPRPEG